MQDNATNPTAFRHLVVSGGGRKGVALLAAIERCACVANFVRRLEGLAGTSVGSLITFSLAATGCLEACRRWVLDPAFWDNEDAIAACPEALLLDRVDWVMREASVPADITFAEFEARTGVRWIINACELGASGRRSLRLLSAAHTPRLPVRTGLAMSCCEPDAFPPIEGPGGRIFVDGGEAVNLLHPGLFAFDSTLAVSVATSSRRDGEALSHCPHILRVSTPGIAYGLSATPDEMVALWRCGVASAERFLAV
jgi:predicted acylesterase/phospholipase RssA